ncbi:calmodulin-like [Eriocheir sinensis]|uniref:calmodulin-like n=1 Tax=Eriocheir sinensis TaxID=95602 RepID=UPI0021CAC684|nr:calmodulin-like [Eriocheir sinensis]XP_050717221.1 calmodulin-like [Eriocheir sinensis]
MSHHSKAFLTEAKECYSIYGKRDGIPIAELGNALRSLGVNPTNTELQNIIADIGSPASVSYDMFMSLLNRDLPPADSPEEIREAFGVFDKDGNGCISATELKHVLMTMGDKLTQEEVDIMIREADIDGAGQIHYEQFVRMMAPK